VEQQGITYRLREYPVQEEEHFLTTEGLEQFPAMSDGCFDVWMTAASVTNPCQPQARCA